jgi:hypothetical protein
MMTFQGEEKSMAVRAASRKARSAGEWRGVIRLPRRVLFPLAFCVATVAGCGQNAPDMVPVTGKVTFGGGPWPKPGVVNFTPFKPAEGFPSKGGSGIFGADGSFVVKTGEYEGLIPGEYHITVTCWEKPPGFKFRGLNYAPEKYTNPAQSGLALKIEPNSSKPVVWEQDIPRAKK